MGTNWLMEGKASSRQSRLYLCQQDGQLPRNHERSIEKHMILKTKLISFMKEFSWSFKSLLKRTFANCNANYDVIKSEKTFIYISSDMKQ